MTSPVYNIQAIAIDKIEANDYNPNKVATPEMKLLELSILEDGYTMPIVCFYDKERDKYIIVDGFHRYQTMLNNKKIYERENGCLPVSVIDKPLEERMASTVRHNRARGEHSVDLMGGMITELVKLGRSDKWIIKHFGMSPDELLRMKQLTGLADLFKDHDYSLAWEIEE